MAEELDDLVEAAAEIIDQLGLTDWTVTNEQGVGDPTTGIVTETPVSYTSIPGSPPVDWADVYGPGFTDKQGSSIVFLPAKKVDGTSVGFEPDIGWKLSRGSPTQTWRVVSVETLQPSSRKAAWQLEVRRIA